MVTETSILCRDVEPPTESATPNRAGFARRSRVAVAAALLGAGCVACSTPLPDTVWIPGPDRVTRLAVAVDEHRGDAWRIGEWIPLRAERSGGPWIAVERTSLPEDACWLHAPPEPHEDDVQANVQWFVAPGGAFEFDLPTPGTLGTRRVRFDAPGTYRVWARTAVWCGDPVESAPIEIVVR